MNDANPVLRERFHNLVSSGVVIPLQYRDDSDQYVEQYDVGTNKSAVDYLDRLREEVRRVACSDIPPWTMNSRGGKSRYVMSKEARRLWLEFNQVDRIHKVWGRERGMHPYLNVGVHLARKWVPRLKWYICENNLVLSEEYPRRVLGHIFRVIRRVCTHQDFRRRIEGLDRKQRENFESCCKYFVDILRTHARPLVLRVDLYLEREAKTAARDGLLGQAEEKFIRNLREDRIIPDVIGYIVRREDSYDRGIHLHLMVIVDGAKHCKSYALAEIVKEYWIQECVGSPELASGFNCYLRKHQYLFAGIGHVHYADQGALTGVREAIRYLTLTDCHFLLPESFGKNLRKGQPPRQPKGKRRGAPRRFGNDVSVAEHILLGKGTNSQPTGHRRQ
ncbi:inovirus-type Gp2 protein [Pseudoxanthomonas jiangsuensis]|uniref:inovirus-type Gp2 protein n=1 Tax=Pseudoxanthomonas jiangsuensis TaxID=619688 RepID=UPI001390CEB4|nr:inovirus-type Gp2 protein [Pseudoxanthomonas jiangsuensis]